MDMDMDMERSGWEQSFRRHMTRWVIVWLLPAVILALIGQWWGALGVFLLGFCYLVARGTLGAWCVYFGQELLGTFLAAYVGHHYVTGFLGVFLLILLWIPQVNLTAIAITIPHWVLFLLGTCFMGHAAGEYAYLADSSCLN